MSLTEYLNTIARSDAREWSVIERPTFLQDHQQISGSGHSAPWIEVEEHHTLLSYRGDLSIGIAFGLPHSETFSEAWAEGFSDSHASSHWVDFLYNGTPILRELSVTVDGARARLPAPKDVSTLEMPTLRVTIWELLDSIAGGGRFAEYFQRAGMKSANVRG